VTAPARAEALFPGYSLASRSYSVAPLRHTTLRRLLVVLGVPLAVIVAAITIAAALFNEPVALYSCPPDCGRPPSGEPVTPSTLFVAADGSFSVTYPSPGSAYDITLEDDGVSAVFTGGDGGTMELFGVPAAGRSAQQVIDDLVSDKQPDATVAYELPNATVGYQLGHGEVLDVYPVSGDDGGQRARIVLLAAVKNDLALVGAAIGPYQQFTPDVGPGLPSAANLQLAEDLGQYVNSFRWKGDPPR
jgi:hypothetical protein